LSFYIALGMSSFITIILFFWGDWFLTLIGSQSILPYMMLLPLSMFFAAMLQIAEQWLIRKKHFKITAKVAVYKSFIVGTLQAGFGFIKPIGAVLIIVATLGSILQAVLLFIGTKRANTKEDLTLNVTVKGKQIGANKNYKQLALSHKDFPIYRAPQVFINAISLSLPVLMLASFFGPAAAGFYTIAMSVLGVPSLLLGKSVGDVFYQRITEATHNSENATRLLALSLLQLLWCLVPGCLDLYLVTSGI
jgi:O-antigen/teichoic acid export membrane protein